MYCNAQTGSRRFYCNKTVQRHRLMRALSCSMRPAKALVANCAHNQAFWSQQVEHGAARHSPWLPAICLSHSLQTQAALVVSMKLDPSDMENY